MNRTAVVAAAFVAALVTGGHAQNPSPLMAARPKPLVVNAKPVRSCESLMFVRLPNTTIESAAPDPNNIAVCRVVASTTHPPAGDRVRIWIAIPSATSASTT